MLGEERLIKLRFLGHLTRYFKEEEALQREPLTLAELIRLQNHLIEGGFRISRANTLILINGVEVSALNGEQTEIRNGDTITFIPITHGG